MSPSKAPHKPILSAGPDHGAPQPTLQQVLNSLDVNLDREIARYRSAKLDAIKTDRLRASQETPVLPQPISPLEDQPKTLPVSSTREGLQPPLSEAPVPPPAMPPNPRLREDSPEATIPPEPANANLAVLPRSPVTSAAAATLVSTQTGSLAGTELLELPPASPPDTAAAPAQASPFPWGHSLKTPLGLGALLLLLVTSAGLGFVLVNPGVVAHLLAKTPWAKNHSLPSSNQAAQVEAPAGKPPSPLSPDLSQREFAPLNLNQLTTLPSGTPPTSSSSSPLSDPSTIASSTDGAPTNPASTERSSAAPVPALEARITQVPLSAQTGRDRPGTASPQATAPTVGAAAAPTSPATAIAPAAPSTVEPTTSSASDPAAAHDDNQSVTPVAPPSLAESPPETQVQPETPTAITLNRTPETSSQPTGDQPEAVATAATYYVVTDYTGDASLDTARTAVADAYVRNFDAGARIQLGAFGSEAAATNLLEDLKRQGIEAEVFNP